MDKRYFTVEEANAFVPLLEGVFSRVLRIRSALRTVSDELSALGEPLSDESLDQRDGTPALIRARGRARGLVETMHEELKSIQDRGIHVKDLDTGLCDFVTRFQNRDVLLCWRLGEKRVGFWHELSSGFSGRKPIDPSMQRLVH